MPAISADNHHSAVNPHETMQWLFAFALEYNFPVVAFTSASHFCGSERTRTLGQSVLAHIGCLFGRGSPGPGSHDDVISNGAPGRYSGALGWGVLNMSDVDWLALWVEFAQATDNKQIEVAERIVYFDGRLDFTELGSSTLLAAARQIIRERV
jgi:hypothetical protein